MLLKTRLKRPWKKKTGKKNKDEWTSSQGLQRSIFQGRTKFLPSFLPFSQPPFWRGCELASQRKSLPGNPCSFFGGTFNSHQPAGEKREKEEAGQTAWEFGNSGKGASLSLVQSTSTIGKSVVLQVEIAFFVDVSCLAVVKVGCIKNYKLTKCFFYSYNIRICYSGDPLYYLLLH